MGSPELTLCDSAQNPTFGITNLCFNRMSHAPHRRLTMPHEPYFADAEDARLVSQTAAEWVARDGAQAVGALRAHASQAKSKGDDLSYRAWRDIADEAERLLRRTGRRDLLN